MKKLMAFVASLFVAASVFAQSGRNLLAGVYNFATESSKTWTIYDANFTSIDTIAEKYVFDASFVIKIAIGLSRYDFTCTVAKDGDDFTVDLTNMESYAVDKNLKIVKSGSKYPSSNRVASEYAKQMKTEIQTRMKSWKDAEYQANLDKAVTSPAVLNCVAKNSALVFKKFLKDYEIIGKTASMKIGVTKVDESKLNDRSYYVAGLTFCGTKVDTMGFLVPEFADVMVFTNSDNVISLTTSDRMDIVLGKAKGSTYEVKGTIKDVTRKEAGGISVIQIIE